VAQLSMLGKLWDALTKGTSPEYASGLLKFGEEGMTQEARMARAAEQGYEGPFYRWTEGGQGNVVRTPESDKGLKFGPAGYASPQPEYGARYVDPTKANVQPLMARGPLADLNEVDRVSQGLIAQRKQAGSPQWPGHQQHWAEMQDALKAEGFRGVRYGDKEIASFNPEENMRSINATFDPDAPPSLLASRPEAAVGAAVLGGGLLAGSSDEAEAAAIPPPISRLIQLGFLGPEYSANAIQVSRATTRYNKAMKESRAFRDREMKAAQNEFQSLFQASDLPEQRIIRPEDLQGKPLIPVKGDQSDIGILSQVGGVPVEDVAVQGGRKFPKQYQEEGYGWASNIGPAEAHLSKARNVAEMTGEQPISIYTAMGADATNFSTPIAESMLKQATDSPLAKKDIAEFDRELRNLTIKKGKQEVKVFPDWVGLESPDAMAQLMGTGDFKNVGKKRTAFTELMGKAKYRDRGFPSYDETLRAVQDPALASAKLGDTGMSSFAPSVQSGLISDPTVHRSYSHVIPGEYQGSLGQNIPFEVMFQDPYTQIADRVAGVPQRINTVAAQKDLYQMADQEWVDRVMGYMEKADAVGKRAAVAGLLGTGAAEASPMTPEQESFYGTMAKMSAEKPQAEMRAPKYGLLADIADAFEAGSRNDLLGSGESAAKVANALAYGQRPGVLDTIIGSFEAVDPITWASLLGAMSKGR
jgi:hypothetical protein